jgi:hypothetical protein
VLGEAGVIRSPCTTCALLAGPPVCLALVVDLSCNDAIGTDFLDLVSRCEAGAFAVNSVAADFAA